MQKTLEKYIELIQKWNKKFNLTADDSFEAIKKHINDSLEVIKFIKNNARVLDLGSGVGFPGIPIKIARPDVEMCLLDSRRKRVSFLSDVIVQLNLNNAKAVEGRAEDLKIIENLDKFDVIISKATWNTLEYLKYSQPYSKKDTIIIAMKSKPLKLNDNFEKNDLSRLGITLWKTHDYKTENTEKTLIIFKKT